MQGIEVLQAYVKECKARLDEDRQREKREFEIEVEKARDAWCKIFNETIAKIPDPLRITAHLPQWACESIGSGILHNDFAYIEIDIDGYPTLCVFWKGGEKAFLSGGYQVQVPHYRVRVDPEWEIMEDGDKRLVYRDHIDCPESKDLYKAVTYAYESAQIEVPEISNRVFVRIRDDE